MPALVGGFGMFKFTSLFNILSDCIYSQKRILALQKILKLNKNYCSKNTTPQNININLLRSQIGPYLAGLIEGNGTISVHNLNNTTKNFSPKIIIVFKKADLPLANYLQNITKCGQVLIKPERGYVLWQIQDIVSIFTIVSIINGFMRTPKIEALYRTIDWLNNYIINNYNINNLLGPEATNILENKPLDSSPIDNNAWLSGFTDADGNFSINIQKRTNKNSTRVQLTYRLEINQNYHKSDIEANKESFFPIISKIGLYLGVTVYSRSRIINDKFYYSFIVVSQNKLSHSKVCDYFNKFSLLSSKFLDYKD
jgi:LAGLIDADG endonuclease